MRKPMVQLVHQDGRSKVSFDDVGALERQAALGFHPIGSQPEEEAEEPTEYGKIGEAYYLIEEPEDKN